MEKLIDYKHELDSHNIQIKIVIKLYYEFYKLSIETYYNEIKSKTESLFRNTSYCNSQIQISR